jgi:hypothetical protein
MFRYLSVLLPLTSILLGLAVSCTFVTHRYVGLGVVALLVFTNALHVIPFGVVDAPGTWSNAGQVAALGRVNFPLAAYLYEVSHDIRDPEDEICGYLKAHAQPSDLVLATYDDLVVQFYTRLQVIGSLQGRDIGTEPDWIVVRQEPDGTWWGGKEEALQRVLRTVDWKHYQRIEIPYPDFLLGKCPEPSFHRFRAPAKGAPILVLHRERLL